MIFAPWPEPPKNARVRRRDGTVLPVELIYQGFDESDEMHVWRTAQPVYLGPWDCIATDSWPLDSWIDVGDE